MAYETGTATNHSDLLDKLITFATAHGWVLTEDNRGATVKTIILQGTGAGGSDEIFVGVRLYADTVTDRFGWALQGYTGHNAGVAWSAQPGAIGETTTTPLPCVPLWNDAITYWFTVSATRMFVVAKVGTSYEWAGLGYAILPYATPGQWPYPLVVAGSALGELRYSDTTTKHTHGLIPLATGQTVGTLRIRDAAGVWRSPQITMGGSAGLTQSGTWPFAEFNVSQYGGMTNLVPVGGVWTLQPIIAFEAGAAGDLYRGDEFGEFDGCKHVAGLANAAENTITVGGDTYLVVKNAFRSAGGDFWALLLA